VAEDQTDLYPDATPGHYVCFSVSDTGGGIPPEVLPRIFEPFFTTKEVGKGTGMGLATVFGIVKQHNGWVKVDSQPGSGATFRIFLPSSEALDEKPAATEKPELRRGSETILWVEDEASVRKLARTILTRQGYHVLEAASGLEALHLWDEHRASIALLLTDMVMPDGISGKELARRLRADQPHLKVIFTSGYNAEISGRNLRLHPGENFIQKPFTPDQLLEIIRRSLND
jgi:CheY-like chemotaxis protein